MAGRSRTASKGSGRNGGTKGLSFETIIERTGAVISACLILALCGYLVWHGLVTGSGKPHFDIVKSNVELRNGVLYQDFDIRNTGSGTAADVHVGAIIGAEEFSEVTFEYIPNGSSRRGTIVVPDTAMNEMLALRVTSYSDP